MDDQELSREWQRGLLPTCVLAVLAHGAAHGYALAQRLKNVGIGPIKGGALYPVLNRLEADGEVTSVWREGEGGPGRKVFEITGLGHERLAQMQREWQPFAEAVAQLLGVALTGSSPVVPDGRRPER